MMILCLPVITSPKCQRVAENITLLFYRHQDFTR